MGAGSSALQSASTSVTFTVNGKSYSVDQPAPWLTLYDWLHSQPDLKATKRMCGEGGCGACVVTLKQTRPEGDVDMAVNAVSVCLRLMSLVSQPRCDVTQHRKVYHTVPNNSGLTRNVRLFFV